MIAFTGDEVEKFSFELNNKILIENFKEGYIPDNCPMEMVFFIKYKSGREEIITGEVKNLKIEDS